MKIDNRPIVISARTSQRMSMMSFVCACMIVAIHSTPSPELGTWQWWAANFLGRDGLCRVAVPWFFFASGFFLAKHFGEPRWYKEAISMRMRTLVVPFVLWGIINLIVNFSMWYGIQVFGYSCAIQNPFANGYVSSVIAALGFDLRRMNVGVIWYLRMLFLLVVASPIVYWCLQKNKYLLPIALCAIYGIYDTVVHFSDLWEYVISIRGMAYFTLGVAMRLYCPENISRFLSIPVKRWIVVVAIGGLLANVFARRVGLVYWENAFDFLMVPPLMYSVWLFTEKLRLPAWSLSQSFAIYLLHGIFLKVSVVAIVMVGFRSCMRMSVTLAILRWGVALFLSIATTMLLKRFFPKIAYVLLGGR